MKCQVIKHLGSKHFSFYLMKHTSQGPSPVSDPITLSKLIMSYYLYPSTLSYSPIDLHVVFGIALVYKCFHLSAFAHHLKKISLVSRVPIHIFFKWASVQNSSHHQGLS